VAAGLFALALSVRLLHLYGHAANPTFTTPIMDQADYDDLARALLEQRPARTPLFWQPPFYPLYLAAVYAVGGPNPLLARVFQCLLGAATVVLTYWLGRRLLGENVGITAALFTALCGPLVFFESELLATGWAAFWAVALLLLGLRAAETRGIVAHLAFGVAGALSISTRPTFLPVFLACAVWLLFAWRRAGWRTGRLAGGATAVAGGFLIISLPLAALNYRLNANFGIMPASGGINFFIGNNPRADETTAFRPGRDWRWLERLPRENGVTGDMWAQQQFFYDQTWQYLREQPLSFAAGLLQKTVQFISAREVPRSVDLYAFRRWSPALAVLTWKVGQFGFPFGVLLPLALLGLLSSWRRLPTPVWLLLMLQSASIVLVFVAARYRAPLLPVIAIAAAAGLLALPGLLRSDRRQRALLGLLLAGTVLAQTLPGPFPAEQVNYSAELYRLLAIRHYQENQLSEAIHRYQQALEYAPGDPDIHAGLARVLLVTGSAEAAVSHYETSLRTRPDVAVNHAALAAALEQTGRLERAAAEYERAVEIDPTYAKAYVNLGAIQRRLGRLEEAIAAFRAAVRLDPHDPIAHHNLGDALADHGDTAGAVESLRQSLLLDPGFEPARRRLAELQQP
jgi:tetratricopeptide (TPR) repeat protein